MDSGVADVVFLCRIGWSINFKFAARRVISCGGFDVGDVGTVTQFGHREAAGKFDRTGLAQVTVVVTLRSERMDRAAEEPELHAELDRETDVVEGSGFEGDRETTHIVGAAILLRIRERANAVCRQNLQLLEDLFAVSFFAELRMPFKAGTAKDLEYASPSCRSLSCRHFLQRRDGERRAGS